MLQFAEELTSSVGEARRAAVLIAVYQSEGTDDLRVLLTTRAKHLRRNPGQTVSLDKAKEADIRRCLEGRSTMTTRPLSTLP